MQCLLFDCSAISEADMPNWPAFAFHQEHLKQDIESATQLKECHQKWKKKISDAISSDMRGPNKYNFR